MPRLLITREDGAQRQAPLTRGTIRLGRDPQADICLEDPGKGVSRFHAEIRYDGSGYTIVDLESRNGTIVNGKRVAQARLAQGTVVNVGPYELRFEGGDMPPADDPGYTVVSPPPPRYQQAPPARGQVGSAPPVAHGGARAPSGPRPHMVLLGAAIAIGAVLAMFAILKIYNSSPAAARGSPPAVTPPPAETRPPSVPPPAPPSTPPPSSQSPASPLAGRLAEAESLINADQPQRALDDIITPLLRVDPANAEAQRLRRAAEDKILELVRRRGSAPRPPAPPPPPPAPLASASAAPAPAAGALRPKPAVPAPEKPVAASAVPRRTGENQVDYDARVQRVRREYAAARAAIDKGELLDAISRLEAVQREQPNYLDSSKLLTDVQQRRRDEARRALDAATKAEESGALLDALPALERAKRYDPSPAVDERIARLHTRMKEEGARAYNDARKLDAFGKAQDAVGLYKRAISLLPADDDRRKDAARRVEALAK